jgi:diaminopimelate epimerase
MGVPKFVGAPDGKLGRRLAIDGEHAIAHAVCMGNPHVVAFVTRIPEDLALQELAETISRWKVFAEEPNVEIAAVGENEIDVRVHERGVGETWACGSGACAVASAAIASGRAASPVSVRTKGGAVSVAWAGHGPAFLTGDAELVFRTEVEI